MARDKNYPLLEILDLRSAAERERARTEFTSGREGLLRLAFEQQLAAAKTVVLEREYVDREYASSYARFYARAFHEYRRRTKRFHFFSSPVAFEDLLDNEHISDLYLGYAIVTADPPRVGRCVFSPPAIGGGHVFVTAKGRFQANLCGADLTVEGVPFIAQDGRVAACASAAIWMSTRAMSRVRLGGQTLYGDEGSRTASLSEITEYATKHTLGQIGEPLLSPGLNIEQMLLAIRELGYSPVIYAPRSAQEARDVIYWYVESQIPPILVISPGIAEEGQEAPAHAVVVTGHLYEGEAKLPVGPNVDVTSSHWSPGFVFHDDQMGPYHTFSLRDPPPGDQLPRIHVSSTGNSEAAFGEGWFYHNPASLWYVIVPLPPRVFLRAEDAEQKARELLQLAYIRLGVTLPTDRVIRTYLTRGNALKQRLIPGKVSGLSRQLAELYRGSLMPRFVWVVEMCRLQAKQAKSLDELLIDADVTIDATSGTDRLDFATLRIPGHFMSMAPEDASVIEAIEDRAVKTQVEPYGPLIRR